MVASYLIGLVVIVVVTVAWVGVQLAWRKTFPEACADPDALAGRMGCHGCDGNDKCSRGDGPAEEELR